MFSKMKITNEKIFVTWNVTPQMKYCSKKGVAIFENDHAINVLIKMVGGKNLDFMITRLKYDP